MATSYKYKGVLARPIGDAHWRAALIKIRTDPNAFDEAEAEGRRLLEERLMALFADCGVSPDNPFALIIELGQRHVPGFTLIPKRRPGRPSKKPDFELFHQMDRTMKRRNLSVRSAAAVVAHARRRGETAAAIETRYRRTIKLIDTITPDFRRMWQQRKAIPAEE